MNEASREFDLGYSVYQRKGEWFIEFKGETIPFNQSSIILER